jgi:hypothetical protein
MTLLNYDDHVRANSSSWSNSVEIAVFGRLNNGDTKVAAVQWETIAESCELKPLLVIRKDHAQVLMDDLWNAGIRPTEGSGSAGAMRMAERHIQDLRAVAFKLLGIEAK